MGAKPMTPMRLYTSPHFFEAPHGAPGVVAHCVSRRDHPGLKDVPVVVYVRSDCIDAQAAIIATLTAERDEALRRRDAWRAKAGGYDEMAAAVRAKVREAGPSAGRMLLREALVAAERRVSRLHDALTMMLAARGADGVAVDAAMLRARAELAKENPNA